MIPHFCLPLSVLKEAGHITYNIRVYQNLYALHSANFPNNFSRTICIFFRKGQAEKGTWVDACLHEEFPTSQLLHNYGDYSNVFPLWQWLHSCPVDEGKKCKQDLKWNTQ